MKKIYSFIAIVAAAMMVVGCKEQPKAELSFVELMEQSSPEQVEAWYNGASCLSEEYTKAHAAELRAQKKLLVFDLDGTLSNHRTPMPEESRELLDKLAAKGYHLVMCGAGNVARVFNQMSFISIFPKTLAPAPMVTKFPIVGWRLPCSFPVPPNVTP